MSDSELGLATTIPPGPLSADPGRLAMLAAASKRGRNPADKPTRLRSHALLPARPGPSSRPRIALSRGILAPKSAESRLLAHAGNHRREPNAYLYTGLHPWLVMVVFVPSRCVFRLELRRGGGRHL